MGRALAGGRPRPVPRGGRGVVQGRRVGNARRPRRVDAGARRRGAPAQRLGAAPRGARGDRRRARDAVARALAVRGVIEGFYGPPWSHAERLDLIRFCGAHGFTTWVHAPKDDPYHRRRWREGDPEAELAQLAELVAACEQAGVELAYALAPGLDVDY